jgi:DNA-binding NarL/FixJ family response regulator
MSDVADLVAPEGGDAIRVLICDDHALFRRGLTMVLAEEDDIEVVGEAEDGDSAVAVATDLVPDVVLMDVRMPKRSGIEATRAIAEAVPSARIVMLTVSDEEDDLYEAIKAGATGYLLKEISIEEVASAIRAVVSGQSLITPSMASKLLTEFSSLSKKAEAKSAVGGPGDEQQGDRRRALHLREHGEEPRPEHPGEAAPAQPDGGCDVRGAGEDPRLVGSSPSWASSTRSSGPARARSSRPSSP